MLLGSIPLAAAAEKTQKQLKDLFYLHRMVSSDGKPLETTEDSGRIRLTAGQQAFFTSNADCVSDNEKSDQYYTPWITADWRHTIGAWADWYAGLNFVNYFHRHNRDLNYSYAELSTGLITTFSQTDRFSAEAYAGLALDCDLDAGYDVDDMEAGVSAGAVLNWKADDGHAFYVVPDFTLLRAFPASKVENSYLSATFTPGWNWVISSDLTAGAYWCRSATWYPESMNEVTFTQYIGANLDWQIIDDIVLGFLCIHTTNFSSRPNSDYSDLSTGINLRFSLNLPKKGR